MITTLNTGGTAKSLQQRGRGRGVCKNDYNITKGGRGLSGPPEAIK